MDWLKSNDFWDFGSKTTAPPPAKPMVAPTGVPPTAGAAPSPQPVTASYLDPAMVADVQKVITRRPGSQFTALQVNAQQLEPVIPDERTRLKAAFQILKGQGTQAARVIGDIDLHIRDIEAEKQNFAAASQAASAKKVGMLRQESQDLISQNQRDEETIRQLSEQIQRLQTSISERAATAATKKMEADQAEAHIIQTVNKFNAAADSVIAGLNIKKTDLSSLLN